MIEECGIAGRFDARRSKMLYQCSLKSGTDQPQADGIWVMLARQVVMRFASWPKGGENVPKRRRVVTHVLEQSCGKNEIEAASQRCFDGLHYECVVDLVASLFYLNIEPMVLVL